MKMKKLGFQAKHLQRTFQMERTCQENLNKKNEKYKIMSTAFTTVYRKGALQSLHGTVKRT